MPSARPLPSVIGPTENALHSLLTQTLAATSIPGYPAWVVLNAVSTRDASDEWRRRASKGLKADADEIDAVLHGLRTAGLVGGGGTLTAAGAVELATARAAVAEATGRLVEGIDEAEQETARRVLDAIRLKAEGLLAS
jgi:hypothetical protein